MMKWWLLHLLLFSVSATLSFAQDSLEISSPPDSALTVDRITIIGNDHTKNFVIMREMSLRPGMVITKELIEYDKSRIYSLRLFNRVQIGVVHTTAGMANLVVEVSERWYLFPYPVFGIKDRDWSKVFYGLGLVHSNFRGRNEKLFATLVLGYDPSVTLSYRNPFLSEEGTYFLDGRIAYNNVRSKSLQAQTAVGSFDEVHFSASITIGRRFGINHTVWTSLSYEVVEISDYMFGRTISSDGKDRFPVGAIGYSYDTRDLSEYPSAGVYARGSITKLGFSTGGVNLVRYGGEIQRYDPLTPGIVLAGRMFADIVAAGPTPSYNRTYLGYSNRIRGHFKEVFEGESILGLSAELHYTLLAPRYHVVDFLPAEFSVWKFGVIVAGFADAGTVWFRNQPVAIDRVVKGYGLGLHFLLPYSIILRTEYAWNEARRGELILDVGAAL